MTGVTMMFFGGIIIAIAVEESKLHERIALRLILLIGTSPRTIMLSFMVSTGFLSMWISNTAATTMMLPMVAAVVKSLSSTNDKMAQAYKGQLGALLLLSVAYSANIGGTGVITGTPPNLLILKVLPEAAGVNFATWMGFAVPLMVINLLVCWIYLMLVAEIIMLFEKRSNKVVSASNPDLEIDMANGKSLPSIEDIVKADLEALGGICYQEVVVILLFGSLVGLWFFQRPRFITGWADLVDDYAKSAKVASATPAVVVVFLLFIVPKSNPFRSIRRGESVESLLTWKTINEKMPWNVLLLLGGGIALSGGFKASGLNEWAVDNAKSLKDYFQVWEINLLVCLLTSTVTEFVSNTATANIALPMLVDISASLCANPVYLVMSAVITCSNAFMLPVATAPNAIVFGVAGGKLTTKQMILIGLPLNLISILITFLAISTWGTALFNLNEFPQWAVDFTNSPSSQNCTVTPS